MITLGPRCHYPFGLVMAGISNKALNGVAENRYKYNGKDEQRSEFSDESGLEWLDYGARFYDVQIARWFLVDPICDDLEQVDKSPYNFSWNNPISLVDPNGMKPLTDFVNISTGVITHIEDDDDQVVAASSELVSQMQNLFENDKAQYNSALERIKQTPLNLNLTRKQFDFLAETVYAESSGGFAESLGIVNVLENRASNQGNNIVDQLSDKSPYGVYGVRKTGSSTYKYSYRNEKGVPSDIKRKNVHRSIAVGLSTEFDITNGAFFWDGKDFNGLNSVNGGYRHRYLPGYLFTDARHDLWGQGNNLVGKTYKYQSTNAIENTTFSKLYKQGVSWYK